MISLSSIELREIRLPLKEPFRISSGVETERRILLLRIEDSEGTATWSECVAGALPNYAPEAIDTAWVALREWVGPVALSQPFESPAALHRVYESRIRGNRMARAAVEMGCWGLLASRDGVPLARLLGGKREAVATGISIGIQDSPHELAVRAAAASEEGYQKIKAKITPGKDVPFLCAAREAIGDRSLMADANNAYTLDDIEVLKQIDDFGLIMIEQPLAWDDVFQHARLQRELNTPICLDESIVSGDRAREMIDLEAGRIINIKPGRVGGFTEARAIHDIAAEAGLPVWCGGMLESGIGRAYNVALASLPNFSLPGDISPSARYWERDVVTPEWTMDGDGFVTVPQSPGIGVDVDEDRIDDLTVRRHLIESTP